jgi:hypothetical protein
MSSPHPPAAALPLHWGGKQAENKPDHVTAIGTGRHKPSVVRQKPAQVTKGLGSLLKSASPTGDGQRGVQPTRQSHAWLACKPAQHQDFRGSRSTPAQLAGFCLEMPRPRGQHHHGGSFVEPCCLRWPSRYALKNLLSSHRPFRLARNACRYRRSRKSTVLRRRRLATSAHPRAILAPIQDRWLMPLALDTARQSRAVLCSPACGIPAAPSSPSILSLSLSKASRRLTPNACL